MKPLQMIKLIIMNHLLLMKFELVNDVEPMVIDFEPVVGEVELEVDYLHKNF